jgi:hypothetical protein
LIFESEDERKAFEFICEAAADMFADRGCDNLDSEQMKVFGHLMVDSEEEDGTPFKRQVVFGGDVVYWLESQVKK